MRHLVAVLVLFSAVVFYAVGFESGVLAAIIVAAGLEILFWTRLVRFGRPLRSH